MINADYGYSQPWARSNSVVGLIFVLGTNAIAKRIGETTLFIGTGAEYVY